MQAPHLLPWSVAQDGNLRKTLRHTHVRSGLGEEVMPSGMEWEEADEQMLSPVSPLVRPWEPGKGMLLVGGRRWGSGESPGRRP